MFMTKRAKIQRYLAQRADECSCAFDALLRDYLDGSFKEKLTTMDIRRGALYVDLREDEKCIDVQGRYQRYYVEMQIRPNEFSVSIDLVEPDEDVVYPLESKEQLYRVLSDSILALK